MWIMLNDAFLSIVKKDCADDELLVRARRPGDIEKVFGRGVRPERTLDSDYLFRAVIARTEVVRAIQNEVLRIDYTNFKSSVADDKLHDAYMSVWDSMAMLQNPRPYSQAYRPKHDLKKQVAALGQDSLLPSPKKNSKRKQAHRTNGAVSTET